MSTMELSSKRVVWDAVSIQRDARRYHGIEFADERALELAEELQAMQGRLVENRDALDIDQLPSEFVRVAHAVGVDK